MAAWKRCSDMRKVCGNIFEDRNVQLYLNVHRRFGGDLPVIRYLYWYMPNLLKVSESQHTERVFVAVDLKFVQMLL